MSKKKDNEGRYTLSLKKKELIHLRDVMSISTQVDLGMKSISSQLNEKVDEQLWKKVWTLLRETSIPVGEAAPDLLVAITQVPLLEIIDLKTPASVHSLEEGDVKTNE